MQIGDVRKGSVPEVVLDSCGHPCRIDNNIGAVVLKDTLLPPDDSRNDIPIKPIAISFPGLSSLGSGHYSDMVFNSRAVPGADAAPQSLPRLVQEMSQSVVDFGIYRIASSGLSLPCAATDMAPQPFVSHALPVRGMAFPVPCLPDSRNYMGACRFHGINTPGSSSNNGLVVIGFGEKVMSIIIPGQPGSTLGIEVTYIAYHSGGGSEPSGGDSGGDVVCDALRSSFDGEAPLHSFICSRAVLSSPGSGGGVGGSSASSAASPPASGAGGPSFSVDAASAASTSISPALACMPALRAEHAPRATLSRVTASATAAVSAYGGTFFTLTPAHLALGFVKEVQADPSCGLPPGPVTFVRPRHDEPAVAAAGGASFKIGRPGQ